MLNLGRETTQRGGYPYREGQRYGGYGRDYGGSERYGAGYSSRRSMYGPQSVGYDDYAPYPGSRQPAGYGRRRAIPVLSYMAGGIGRVGRNAGVGFRMGGPVGALALVTGTAAIAAGAFAVKTVYRAGRGALRRGAEYYDKYKHESEFQKLSKFNSVIRCRYDGTDLEFGRYMTEHGYANLEPFSAVEFTAQSKYGSRKVCLYLPTDVNQSGLGDDIEENVVGCSDAWFDMLSVPDEHRHFYTPSSPLEFKVLNLTAYYVPPRGNMVKADQNQCVGLLLRSPEAVEVVRKMVSNPNSNKFKCLLGAEGALRVGYVVMIDDIDAFFKEPVVRKFWAEMNPKDPTGKVCLAMLQESIESMEPLQVDEENGITCTSNYIFGRPWQKIPLQCRPSMRSMRETRRVVHEEEIRERREVSRQYGGEERPYRPYGAGDREHRWYQEQRHRGCRRYDDDDDETSVKVSLDLSGSDGPSVGVEVEKEDVGSVELNLDLPTKKEEDEDDCVILELPEDEKEETKDAKGAHSTPLSLSSEKKPSTPRVTKPATKTPEPTRSSQGSRKLSWN